MSDGQLKAFERNNYFYGKLLTVRDFETEQDYFNEKRHLLNRLVHGAGIVCGLHTEIVDNRGVRLDPGVAIDGWGREIVVGREFLKTDIREVTGYPLEREGAKTLYLLLEYDEASKESVPALMNTSSCEDISESNRILENFRLTLTETPVRTETGWSSLWNETSSLYQKGKLKLERTAAKWVKGEDVFEVVIKLTALQTIGPEEVWEAVVTDELPETLVLLYTEPMRFIVSNVKAGTIIEKRYIVRAGVSSGPHSISGRIVVSVNGGSVEEKRTSTNTVTIFTEKAVSEKAVELHFAEQKNEDLAGVKKPGVLLATLTINEEGFITRMSELGRRFVYNNPLLGRLVKFEEDRMGKLPFHGLSHGADGEDPLDVSNLSGLLADPQWVAVYTEKDKFIQTRRFTFEGEGVQVDTDPQAEDHVRVRISGVAHADSHQAGGLDPINVSNLKGVLADPQKISVGFAGNTYSAKGIRFSGDGASATMQGDLLHVDITGGGSAPAKSEVITGRVIFSKVNNGDMLVSPYIEIPFDGPAAIQTALEYDFTGMMGSIVGVDANISVIYDLNKKQFRIVLLDARYENGADPSVDLTVRYWIIPSSTQNGDVMAESSDVPWYKEYVLSRVYLTGGASLQQLQSYPLLWKAEKLEEVLKELVEEGYLMREGDFFHLTY